MFFLTRQIGPKGVEFFDLPRQRYLRESNLFNWYHRSTNLQNAHHNHHQRWPKLPHFRYFAAIVVLKIKLIIFLILYLHFWPTRKWWSRSTLLLARTLNIFWRRISMFELIWWLLLNLSLFGQIMGCDQGIFLLPENFISWWSKDVARSDTFDTLPWAWHGSLLLAVADTKRSDRLSWTSDLWWGWASSILRLISHHMRFWEWHSLTLLGNVITVAGDTMTRDNLLRTVKRLHHFHSIRLDVRMVCALLHFIYLIMNYNIHF